MISDSIKIEISRAAEQWAKERAPLSCLATASAAFMAGALWCINGRQIVTTVGNGGTPNEYRKTKIK